MQRFDDIFKVKIFEKVAGTAKSDKKLLKGCFKKKTHMRHWRMAWP